METIRIGFGPRPHLPAEGVEKRVQPIFSFRFFMLGQGTIKFRERVNIIVEKYLLFGFSRTQLSGQILKIIGSHPIQAVFFSSSQYPLSQFGPDRTGPIEITLSKEFIAK